MPPKIGGWYKKIYTLQDSLSIVKNGGSNSKNIVAQVVETLGFSSFSV
jgi:hypothetical protein